MNSISSLLNVEALRYRNDSLAEYGLSPLDQDMQQKRLDIRSRNLARSVLIVPELFPDIWAIISELKDLLIPDVAIEGYVFSSGEAQAYSFGHGVDGSVTLALSSGLIERFSGGEIRFVIGHEISHTLFGHLEYPPPDPDSPPLTGFNLLALARSREISADRVGFIACGSTEASFRAMLKLASGLSDKHIRFDLATYLDQARTLISTGGSRFQLLSTHPMITSRVRTLLWFEMSDRYYEASGKTGKAPLTWDKLEDKVQNELAAAGGFHLARINEAAAFAAVLWGTLAVFLADGTLNQGEQVLMRKTFGNDAADAAIEFARSSNSLDLDAKLAKTLYQAVCLPVSIRNDIISDIERLTSVTDLGPSEKALLDRFREELSGPA